MKIFAPIFFFLIGLSGFVKAQLCNGSLGDPGFRLGVLMILTDHISFATANPLIGKNFTELGPRFPDMSHPYSKKLIHKVTAIPGK